MPDVRVPRAVVAEVTVVTVGGPVCGRRAHRLLSEERMLSQLTNTVRKGVEDHSGCG
jgi:hypothetical protein